MTNLEKLLHKLYADGKITKEQLRELASADDAAAASTAYAAAASAAYAAASADAAAASADAAAADDDASAADDAKMKHLSEMVDMIRAKVPKVGTK